MNTEIKKQARIAIVSPVYPPYKGGIGTLAALDAKQLAELGHAVDVFTPDRGLTSWLRWGNAALVPGVMGLCSGKYSHVVLHYPFFGGAEFIALAKRLHPQTKLIVVYHMDVVGSSWLRWLFRLHTSLVMPFIIRSADHVIVTTKDYAANGNVAPLMAARPDRFVEMPPAVDHVRFAPASTVRGGTVADSKDKLSSSGKDAALLAKYGLLETDRVVAMLGGLDRAHYFKGVPVLLRALATKALAGVKAVIIGDGDLRASYEALAKSLGLAERVVFAGAVSDAELPATLRLADLFVFPSLDRSEAFGIAALEAMTSGLPVVASDLPGVRTIAREGETGLRVFPGSVSALAAGIDRLFQDDGLRRKMGAQARVMAINEYSEAARLEKWRSLLAL